MLKNCTVTFKLACFDLCSGLGERLVCDANFNIRHIGGAEVSHQADGPRRANHLKRTTPSTEFSSEPAREPDIRNADHVVGMEVCKQKNIDAANRNAELKQPHGSAPPGIDQYALAAGLDQGRRSVAAGSGRGIPVPSNVTRNCCSASLSCITAPG